MSDRSEVPEVRGDGTDMIRRNFIKTVIGSLLSVLFAPFVTKAVKPPVTPACKPYVGASSWSCTSELDRRRKAAMRELCERMEKQLWGGA